MERYTFYDFFAGAGLTTLGMGRSWQCVWANDIDPKKAEVYEANFGPRHFVLGDVAKIGAADLPRGADMAWASFPCQDLSLAGWRRGITAERSGTFWAFWRIMRDMAKSCARPPLIAIENVIGLLHPDSFVPLCEALAALGMQFGALVIDARWFVPQSRPRVFFVAVDESVVCKPHYDARAAESPWVTAALRRAQSMLPDTTASRWRWWRLPLPQASAAAARLADLIEGESTGTAPHTEAETHRLLDMMSPANRAKVDAARRRGGLAVGMLYKRMRNGEQRAEVRFDGVAGCLRTPNGGSSRQTVLIVRDGAVSSRLLSPREAARLMGAPDDFWLPGNYNDAYRAMGDAVAVPAVAWLSKHLLTPLAKICREAGRSSLEYGDSAAPERSHQVAETYAKAWESGTS